MIEPIGGAQPLAWTSRALHWSMAILLLAMLFIGVGMVASLADDHLLLSLHRPLGVLISSSGDPGRHVRDSPVM